MGETAEVPNPIGSAEAAERSEPGESVAALGAAGEPEAEGGIATEEELNAWVWLDWGHSVYSTLGASGFLPLLIQTAGLEAAGFPTSCPNVVSNTTFLAAAGFPNATVGYLTSEPLMSTCVTSSPLCIGQVCSGLPPTTVQCRSADGASIHPLRAGGVDPTSMSQVFVSLSTLTQAIAMLTIGPLADYGINRYRQLIAWSVMGSITAALAAATTKDSWWFGGIMYMFSNPGFGMTMVMGNAYLPILIAALPDVIAAKKEKPPSEVYDLVLRKSDDLSSRGFVWGFVAGLVSIIIVIPFTFFLPTMLVYQLSQVFAGVWWIVTILRVVPKLKKRPGLPWPRGRGFLSLALEGTRGAICLLGQLPITGLYLLCWFLMSDGVFIIGSVGGIYANSIVNWGCIPKSLGIAGLFFLAPTFAAIGGMFYSWLALRQGWHSRTSIIVCLLGLLLIPLYGLLGYADLDIGLKQGWETWMVAVVYGFGMGPFQSFSRSLFSTLIPRGKEGSLNGLYELTDKGSSIIGPAVFAAIQAASNDIRPGMFYIILAIGIPIVLMLCLDLEQGTKDAQDFAEAEALRSSEEGEVGGSLSSASVEMVGSPVRVGAAGAGASD